MLKETTMSLIYMLLNKPS